MARSGRCRSGIVAFGVAASLAAVILGPMVSSVSGQGTNQARERPRDLSPLLRPILDKHHMPGMAAAIVQGRKTVGLGAVGVRQSGRQEKVSTDDLFHLGSCSKSMTATLCARLVERGRLSWDTTIKQVFPELAKTMHADYRGVTLEQLLTHRGGVPHDVPPMLWALAWAHRGKPTDARRLLLEGTIRSKPEAKPGSMYIYSNTGFSIAGHMAEQVSDKAWENLMTEGIFKPLRMDSAGFGAPGSPDVLDQPRGHTKDGKPVKPGPWGKGDNPVAIGPANSVHCSIGDWAKYIALHLRGAQGDARLLEADTFTKLHTPARGPGEKYAMGWLVATRDWGGGEVLTHFGSNTMWSAETWIAPKRDFAVLVGCNQGGVAARVSTDQAAWVLIQDCLHPPSDP